MKNKISGAQAMVNCLHQEGVTIAFGYPGATIIPFYDSLLDSSIRHILTRGEQSAGHAASGYAAAHRKNPADFICLPSGGPIVHYMINLKIKNLPDKIA